MTDPTQPTTPAVPPTATTPPAPVPPAPPVTQMPPSSTVPTMPTVATAPTAEPLAASIPAPSISAQATIPPAPAPTPALQPILSGQPFDAQHPQRTYSGPKPTVLLVLDGWGIGPNNAGNAIARANTPNLDRFWLTFPHTQLSASGEAVGLPRGEDGNTETGHLNIGAGNIVYQDLPRINMAIADGSFMVNQAFTNAINHVKTNNSVLHVMGLIGSGGVHSNIEHLYALLNFCKQQQVQRVYIHGFTDGRDSPPTSGINYVKQIMDRCKELGVGHLATLMGRYYGMDRDKRWERIEKAYNALIVAAATCTEDPIGEMQKQYDGGTTDEFIEPISICNGDGSPRVIQDNDAVIFFNYRIDRPRELTRAFVQPDFEQGIKHQAFDPYTEKYLNTNIQPQQAISTFQRKKVLQNLYFVTMTMYEEGLPVDIAFPPQFVKHPLSKVFADQGLHQLRTTETEKERFVTYYMNGQKEEIYFGEDRVIVPSKGAKSYDQVPEMSAREIAAEMIPRIQSGQYDVIIANICNGDMVGHTGNLDATIQACQVVDEVVGQIVNAVYAQGGVVLITADHGNAEELINNQTGAVDTEHSTYPVPFMIIGPQYANKPISLPAGILADVAPTMLHIMGLPKPESMTGRALI